MVYNVLPFFMETCPPCEYAIAEGEYFTSLHNSMYLVCVPYRAHLPNTV